MSTIFFINFSLIYFQTRQDPVNGEKIRNSSLSVGVEFDVEFYKKKQTNTSSLSPVDDDFCDKKNYQIDHVIFHWQTQSSEPSRKNFLLCFRDWLSLHICCWPGQPSLCILHRSCRLKQQRRVTRLTTSTQHAELWQKFTILTFHRKASRTREIEICYFFFGCFNFHSHWNILSDDFCGSDKWLWKLIARYHHHHHHRHYSKVARNWEERCEPLGSFIK